MTLSYQERLTRRFFDLVSQHYLTRHNVSFYADQLCVTPKSLSAAIKNTTRHTRSGCTKYFWSMQNVA